MKMFILLFSLGIGVSQMADAKELKDWQKREQLKCQKKAIAENKTMSFWCSDFNCHCDPATRAVPGGQLFSPLGGSAPQINPKAN